MRGFEHIIEENRKLRKEVEELKEEVKKLLRELRKPAEMRMFYAEKGIVKPS